MKQLLLLTLLQINVLAFAQWEEINIPFASDVYSITSSPVGYLYANTPDATYRSNDIGESWIKLELPLLNPQMAINQAGNVFIAKSDYVYRSLDFGDSWELMLNETVDFRDVVITPDGDVVVGSNFWETGPSLYISEDNGNTWTIKNIGGYREQLSLAVNSLGYLFMGTENDLLRSTDNGDSWTNITPTELIGQPFFKSIAFDSDNEIYLGLGFGNGLYHSANHGDNWSRVFIHGESAIAVNSVNQVYTGSYDLYHSGNHGYSWSPMNEGLSDLTILSLCVDNMDNVFAGTKEGIYRLNAGSQIWVPVNDGILDTEITSITSTLQELYAVRNGLLFKSNDSGLNWEKIDLPQHNLEVTMVKTGPDEVVYAVGSVDDYYNMYGIVFRSTDHGITWNPVLHRQVSQMEFNQSNDIFIISENELLRSLDNGINWTTLNTQQSCFRPSALAISNNEAIYVSSDTCETAVYVSTDNGDTWSDAGSDLLTNVIQLATNTQGEVFALTQASELFTSPDNGSTWQEINSLPSTQITDIQIDYHDNLFLATELGIYTSTDNGASWSPMNEDIENPAVSTIHISLTGYLYSGYSEGQLLRMDLYVGTTNLNSAEIHLFPNPARAQFHLDYPGYSNASGETIAGIYTIQGTLVSSFPVTSPSEDIDITGLSGGIYFIRLNNGFGKKLIVQ